MPPFFIASLKPRPAGVVINTFWLCLIVPGLESYATGRDFFKIFGTPLWSAIKAAFCEGGFLFAGISGLLAIDEVNSALVSLKGDIQFIEKKGLNVLRPELLLKGDSFPLLKVKIICPKPRFWATY